MVRKEVSQTAEERIHDEIRQITRELIDIRWMAAARRSFLISRDFLM